MAKIEKFEEFVYRKINVCKLNIIPNNGKVKDASGNLLFQNHCFYISINNYLTTILNIAEHYDKYLAEHPKPKNPKSIDPEFMAVDFFKNHFSESLRNKWRRYLNNIKQIKMDIGCANQKDTEFLDSLLCDSDEMNRWCIYMNIYIIVYVYKNGDRTIDVASNPNELCSTFGINSRNVFKIQLLNYDSTHFELITNHICFKGVSKPFNGVISGIVPIQNELPMSTFDFCKGFIEPENLWSCNTCTFKNDEDSLKCELCGTLKPKLTPDSQPKPEDTKICNDCMYTNKFSKKKCVICDPAFNKYLKYKQKYSALKKLL
jgi:hypothetical protein